MKICKSKLIHRIVISLLLIVLAGSLFVNYKFITMAIQAKEKNVDVLDYFPACAADLTLKNLLLNSPKE